MTNIIKHKNTPRRASINSQVSWRESQKNVQTKQLIGKVQLCLEHLRNSITANMDQMEHLVHLMKCKKSFKSNKIKQIYATLSSNKANHIYFQKTKDQLIKYNYQSHESIFRVYVRMVQKLTTKIVYYLSNSQFLPFIANYILEMTKRLQTSLRRINFLKDPHLLFDMLGKIFQENHLIEEKIYEVLVDKGYLLCIQQFYTINGIDLDHRQNFKMNSQQQPQDTHHPNNQSQTQIKYRTRNIKKTIKKKQSDEIKNQFITQNKTSQINKQIKSRLSDIILKIAQFNHQNLQVIKEDQEEKQIYYKDQIYQDSFNTQSIEQPPSPSKFKKVVRGQKKKTFTNYLSPDFSKVINQINHQNTQIEAEKAIISLQNQIYQRIGRKNNQRYTSGFNPIDKKDSIQLFNKRASKQSSQSSTKNRLSILMKQRYKLNFVGQSQKKLQFLQKLQNSESSLGLSIHNVIFKQQNIALKSNKQINIARQSKQSNKIKLPISLHYQEKRLKLSQHQNRNSIKLKNYAQLYQNKLENQKNVDKVMPILKLQINKVQDFNKYQIQENLNVNRNTIIISKNNKNNQIYNNISSTKNSFLKRSGFYIPRKQQNYVFQKIKKEKCKQNNEGFYQINHSYSVDNSSIRYRILDNRRKILIR